MRIAIVHNAIDSRSPADEQDVWTQVQAISGVLCRMGHEPLRCACGLDLDRIRRQLMGEQPDMVFNLVESLNGTGRLIHFFPGLLDAMGLPYTGASAEALFLTSNKLIAKSCLRAAGLPTPDWAQPGASLRIQGTPASQAAARWIVKSVWEHASIGLDAQAILDWSGPERMNTLLKSRAGQLGGACFAEAFIEGREFNLSLLDSPDGPQVLPPAEIRFEDFDPGRPRIVDYRAKWETDSFEYRHTPRCFDFDAKDQTLLEHLEQLARACWQVFDLTGYARVDFRVDHLGRPWILEVNANPCLSPDAGFAAAVESAGLAYTEAVARILGAGAASTTAPTAISATVDQCGQPRKQLPEICWRYAVAPEDTQRIRDLVATTGFFYPEEVAIAVELVEERLAKGDASDYCFILAEHDGRLLGYSCYGPVPGTQSSYDLYWIAVHPELQRSGLGCRLIEETEQRIRAAGGQGIYVETSQRPQYAGTRRFYERCGYRREALLPDFYAPGDGKAIYCKRLASPQCTALGA